MMVTNDGLVDLASKMANAWAESRPPAPWSRRAGAASWDSMLARSLCEQITGRTLPRDLGNETVALFMVRWFQCGLPRFDLGHHAATAFALTDVGDVRWSDVRFPFDTTMIVMPSPSPVRMLGLSGQWLDVRRVLVHRTERFGHEDSAEIEARLWAVHHGKSRSFDVSSFRGREIEGYDFVAYADDGTQLFANAHKIRSDETIHDSFFEHIKRGDEDDRAIRAFVSVAVNVALWLAQQGVRPVERPPVPRTDRRGRVLNDSGYRPVIYTVGETIKLAEFSRLREHVRAYFEQGGERGGWRVQARHSVRGHWKQQAFGTGRQERKRLFVQPYWRGPEAGQALSKTYAVEVTPPR